MPDKLTVMVVDDDEIARITLRTFLEDTYDIVEADSAKACLEQLNTTTPNIFLLDVMMPEMNGFELCEELRRREASKATPVMFISAQETAEDIRKGFESGGNGFLLKPVKQEKLLALIDFKIKQSAELLATQKANEEAMRVAMEAMTTSSELGQLIQFVKDADHESTLEGLGARLCAVTEAFGLRSTAIIRDAEPVYVNCEEGSPEALLLVKASNINQRIVSRGIRSVIRSDTIALMVNDMPVDDESKYGRFKDNLVVLTSICDGRCKAIIAQNSQEKQRARLLKDIISVTEKQLYSFREKLKEHESISEQAMSNILTEIESKLFHLGLDDDQEEQLMKVIYQINEKLDYMKGDYKTLEQELGCILESLYELL